ncbi:MAG: hypothetical protein HC849_01525 [Oscillatoriales cyanobacterium RU_3_3]|nr:hypothetical protein [Oscillatoriales cyanobacterium RU_3_3]
MTEINHLAPTDKHIQLIQRAPHVLSRVHPEIGGRGARQPFRQIHTSSSNCNRSSNIGGQTILLCEGRSLFVKLQSPIYAKIQFE